jgi:DNA mismatch endonuclease, patch repair protein
MADVLTPEQRSGNMAAIKGKDTYPEMRVRRLLHRSGYRYTLHASHLPGKPDLVFSSRKKVVFVHGCYWHCHDCKYGNVIPKTNTAFWQEKRARNVARDLEQEKALASQGWKVFVVWECEAQTKDLAGLASRLSAFLNE